jgi:mRNA-degrading endonuclease YafQ of YafQ-DinJ toxin-antitoxin module
MIQIVGEKQHTTDIKKSRKDKKKESKIDWQELYKMLSKLANEFKHHMPFKVLKVKSAEADDVIGVLARNI